MRYIASVLVGICLLCSVTANAAEMRIWTAINGQTVEAKFIQMTGPKAVLEKPDGKRITIAKKKLCQADQKYLAGVIPPELKIEVKDDTETRKTQEGYSYVSKEETITLSVTIKKTNRDKCTRKLRAKVYMIAESKGSDSSNKVIEVKEQSFDFLRGTTAKFNVSSTVRNTEGYSYNSGWEYEGYVMTVTTEDGQVIATDASKSTYLSKLSVIEKNRNKSDGFKM